MEYATTDNDRTQEIFGANTASAKLRIVLQGIRDGVVTCLHCADPAVLLRKRVGRAVPLCRQHGRVNALDRQISDQRARAATMRRR